MERVSTSTGTDYSVACLELGQKPEGNGISAISVYVEQDYFGLYRLDGFRWSCIRARSWKLVGALESCSKNKNFERVISLDTRFAPGMAGNSDN